MPNTLSDLNIKPLATYSNITASAPPTPPLINHSTHSSLKRKSLTSTSTTTLNLRKMVISHLTKLKQKDSLKTVQRKFTAGFSLMELIIVIAIIGILVAVAVPSYKTYMRRAHYAEIVQAAAPYKVGVEQCFQLTNQLQNCGGGENGVPPNLSSNEGKNLVNSITVSEQGVITIVPQEKFGFIATDDYVLTPVAENEGLTWRKSGGGVTAGYAS